MHEGEGVRDDPKSALTLCHEERLKRAGGLIPLSSYSCITRAVLV